MSVPVPGAVVGGGGFGAVPGGPGGGVPGSVVGGRSSRCTSQRPSPRSRASRPIARSSPDPAPGRPRRAWGAPGPDTRRDHGHVPCVISRTLRSGRTTCRASTTPRPWALRTTRSVTEMSDASLRPPCYRGATVSVRIGYGAALKSATPETISPEPADRSIRQSRSPPRTTRWRRERSDTSTSRPPSHAASNGAPMCCRRWCWSASSAFAGRCSAGTGSACPAGPRLRWGRPRTPHLRSASLRLSALSFWSSLNPWSLVRPSRDNTTAPAADEAMFIASNHKPARRTLATTDAAQRVLLEDIAHPGFISLALPAAHRRPSLINGMAAVTRANGVLERWAVLWLGSI